MAPAGPGSIPMGRELHQCSPVCLQAVRRRHNTKCFCALRADADAIPVSLRIWLQICMEMQKFFLAILRTHNANPYVSETHESFRYWNTIPTSLHFLFILM